MKPKKHLGQHFLKNRIIAKQIVETADVKKSDIVLEVGPGRGALTELLLQKAGRVVAIEKDKDLVRYLKDRFVHYENLGVIFGDILEIDPDALWGRGSDRKRRRNYKIVANIPYYITSRFLRQFLKSNCQPSLMALMVQKEVGERIVAKDGKESLLSISVKAYGQPKIIAKVPAGNFSPKPKVDSVIIAIENISKDFFNPLRQLADGGNKIDEKRFFQLLKLGFSHKRKLLKNNLTPLFIRNRVSNNNRCEEILRKCKIPLLSRAEELSLEQWKHLYFAIS